MSISDVKKYFTIWAVHYLSGDKPVPVWRVSRYKHLPFCLWMQNYDCKIRDVKYSSKRAAMIYPLYIEKGCCSYRAISQKAILRHLRHGRLHAIVQEWTDMHCAITSANNFSGQSVVISRISPVQLAGSVRKSNLNRPFIFPIRKPHSGVLDESLLAYRNR